MRRWKMEAVGVKQQPGENPWPLNGSQERGEQQLPFRFLWNAEHPFAMIFFQPVLSKDSMVSGCTYKLRVWVKTYRICSKSVKVLMIQTTSLNWCRLYNELSTVSRIVLARRIYFSYTNLGVRSIIYIFCCTCMCWVDSVCVHNDGKVPAYA